LFGSWVKGRGCRDAAVMKAGSSVILYRKFSFRKIEFSDMGLFNFTLVGNSVTPPPESIRMEFPAPKESAPELADLPYPSETHNRTHVRQAGEEAIRY